MNFERSSWLKGFKLAKWYFFSAKEIIYIPPFWFSSNICHYLYSNNVIPPFQPPPEEAKEIIQHFEANLDENQPPLIENNDAETDSEDESKLPFIPFFICMQEEAVIMVLCCGHMCYCLNCVHLFKEIRNRHCPICSERILGLFRIYY